MQHYLHRLDQAPTRILGERLVIRFNFSDSEGFRQTIANVERDNGFPVSGNPSIMYEAIVISLEDNGQDLTIIFDFTNRASIESIDAAALMSFWDMLFQWVTNSGVRGDLIVIHPEF